MSFEQIRDIIANVLQLDPSAITTDKSFGDDLGADSLDKVEIIMQIEDTLHIEIPDEDAETINTVGDALDKINALLS